MKDRDTYKYHLKQGLKIIGSGITNDLERRQRKLPRVLGEGVHLQQVGRRTTTDAARAWEDDPERPE